MTHLPLVEQHCRPLARGTAPLVGPALDELRAELHSAWRVLDGPCLARRFESRDYPGLLKLVSGIGALAQAEDHHPEMELAYGGLWVSISTHSIGGLSLNDFVLAAKIDRIAAETRF